MTLRPGDSIYVVWFACPGREGTRTIVAGSVDEALEGTLPEWAVVFHLHTVAGPHALAMT